MGADGETQPAPPPEEGFSVGEVGEGVEAEDEVGGRGGEARIDDVATEPRDLGTGAPQRCAGDHPGRKVDADDPSRPEPGQQVRLEPSGSAAQVDDLKTREIAEEGESE